METLTTRQTWQTSQRNLMIWARNDAYSDSFRYLLQISRISIRKKSNVPASVWRSETVYLRATRLLGLRAIKEQRRRGRAVYNEWLCCDRLCCDPERLCCDPKGSRTFWRFFFTEGRGVRLCWVHLQPNGLNRTTWGLVYASAILFRLTQIPHRRPLFSCEPRDICTKGLDL